MKQKLNLFIFSGLILTISLLFSSLVYSQSNELSQENKNFIDYASEKFGALDKSRLDSIFYSAESLFKDKNYNQAVRAFNEYLEFAPILIQIVEHATLPFYNASKDEKDALEGPFIARLSRYERDINTIKKNMLTSYLRLGNSYYLLGDINNSIISNMNALEYITVNSPGEWESAATSLRILLGF